MNPLLISGFATSINVDKRKLIVHNKIKNEKHEFYPHKINHDSIILDGHTGNITFESMRWLMKHDIHLSLLNWNGNLLGVILPESSNSGRLKIKQYQKYLDKKFRFKIASKITKSKIANSFNLLNELARYYDEINIKIIKNHFLKENQNYSKITKKKTEDLQSNYSDPKSVYFFNKLMTYEGRIASFYFEELAKIFNKLHPEFHFKVRKDYSNARNYNASDEINALLNYGYAVLESEIRKAINSVGLDPSIGFLHELTPNRSPLVYDIQELFRWLIDLSVIELLEDHPKLKKSDFILTENYNIRLKENTAKRLITKIKLNFNTKVSYRAKRYYYQTILADFVRNLALFVAEKRSEIEFSIPEIKIQRKDTLELKNKILKLSPEERRRLGINKSTLWYIKNNIENDKSIKIYDKILSKLVKE